MKNYVLAYFLLFWLAAITALATEAREVNTPALKERGLSEHDFPRTQQISPNVYTYEALTGPVHDRYTTNTMFVVTDEGVLVADGQGSNEETKRLIEAIGAVTEKPITHVVICSDHGDHTNGNQMCPKNTQFIAHHNSLPALKQAADDGGILPNVIIDKKLALTLGSQDIEILFLGRAHTGGDLFVWLPGKKILFTTEVFLNHMFSGYRSAYPSEWIVTMNEAETFGAEVYVPGHGFIDSPTELKEEWYEYKHHLQTVLDEVIRLHGNGISVENAIKKANFGKYSTWPGVDSQAPIGVRRIYAELDNLL